ncbi:MAG: hypothetical protein ACK5O2_14000 [Microthrixaceae bacterium]
MSDDQGSGAATPQDPSTEADDADPRGDLEALRAERDAALAELAQLRETPPPRRTGRRILTGTLVVISCVAFLTSTIGIWANRNFLNTGVWVDHVGPLAENPAVQEALSKRITAELMQIVDPKELFEEALPERGQILAVPLSGAVEGFVRKEVDKFVASRAFDTLWVAINRNAHRAAVNLIEGRTPNVEAGDDTITVNLLPLINQVLAQITSTSPEVFGRTINIPDIQIDEVPSEAIDKFNDTFGTDLPDNFGQITIRSSGTLEQVQDAVALFNKIIWISIAVFVASTIGAFALSVNRRRTFYQLAITAVFMLFLLRRVGVRVEDQILQRVPPDGSVPAVKAVTDALLQGLFDGTRVALWLLIPALVIVWGTGPSARAGAVRARIGAVGSSLMGAARERGSDPAVLAWIQRYRDALRFAGVVVAIVLLVWLSLSWLWILILILALAAYEIGLERLTAGSDDQEVSGGDVQ